MVQALSIVASGGSAEASGGVPPYVFAIISVVFFTVLLMMTFTFRHVGRSRR